ncbi:MAG: hypothetical protein H6623_01345 [Bdellovibrionaceae bacterium]|nr:hypothetical protein [Pseudobdellovibrionaceae bacterium]
MEIFIIAGITVFFFLAYAVIAILYPEWVGITGKKAQEIEAEHRTEENPVLQESHDHKTPNGH